MTGPHGRFGGAADLAMGARMAVAGGREGWLRALLTACGVGIGVAMLLLAASVPGALDAREARTEARDDFRPGQELSAGPDTLLVASVDTVFRDQLVRGRLLRAEGPDAPLPPGLAALPGPGEVVVSPALRELLDSADGDLLAPRLGDARVTGTVGAQGLSGPRELAFYLGSDTLGGDGAMRIDQFGGDGQPDEPLHPTLMLLVVIIFVVLLLPLLVFVGTAVRFGGDRRDRRLAALRLVGADTAMVGRIAAGEALLAALLGVAVGGLLFAAGRLVVPLVTMMDISVYAADVRPPLALVALVVLGVPALAVAVALLALRAVVVEPLGVTRTRPTVRRRLWWRLLLPACGLALLLPLAGIDTAAPLDRDQQVAAGVGLLLIGTVTLLPWLVERVVRRLRGGPVAWQLAIRRLQVDPITSARLVNGITVAVAGTIGLQMLFTTVAERFTYETGQDPSRAQMLVQVPAGPDTTARLHRLTGADGVTEGFATLVGAVTVPGPDGPAYGGELRVGDCAALAEFARFDRCADGDVFLVQASDPQNDKAEVRPGDRITVDRQTSAEPTVADAATWRVPPNTPVVPERPHPAGWQLPMGLLVTPGAVDEQRLGSLRGEAFLRLDPADPDAVERVRATAASIDLSTTVVELRNTRQDTTFATIRRGLYLGAVVTLLLIGASMLVGLLEQLRERRRLLAMLAAVGTRHSTLGWSLVWQTAVPVTIGLALAVGVGIALGAVLARLVSAPVAVDWLAVGVSAGLAAGVVLLVTGASLPVLSRLLRPDGLRTE